MTTLTTNTGFLTPEGITICEKLRSELKYVLAIPDNEINLRTLGCALKAMVSDEISAAMLKVRNDK